MAETDLDRYRGQGTPSSVTGDPRVRREMQSQGLTLDPTQFIPGMTGRRVGAGFVTEAYNLSDVRPNTGYVVFQRGEGGRAVQLRYSESPDAPVVVFHVDKKGRLFLTEFNKEEEAHRFTLPEDALLVPFTRPRYA